MRKIENFFCILLLAASSHAATLTCQFNPGQLPSSYMCQIMGLQVTQVNEVITVANPPFPNYYDNETTNLMFDPTMMSSGAVVIQEFPKLFDIFRRIQYISVNNISISEVPTNAFYNCKQLTDISVQYSVLGHIRARFASTCYFVRSLNIYYSKVTSIDQDAFVGMTGLQMLSLYQNGLTCLPARLFHPLIGLNSLMLSYNNLTAVHSQAFKGLVSLHQIDLGYNQIQYIPCYDLNTTGVSGMGGPSSLSLNMYENPIRAICPSLVTSIYYGRMSGYDGQVYLTFQSTGSDIPGSLVSCIDPSYQTNAQNAFMGDAYQIGMNSYDWVRQDLFYREYTTCYSAFTSQMASDSLVTCGSPLTTTAGPLTTVPGGSPSDPNAPTAYPPGQCATDKICRYYLDWNNQYTCVIDGAEGTVTSITGTHYLTYTNTDVKRVYFINSHLSLVPKILFQTFPNLKFLHTANSGMTVINDQTFNECGVLELWDASDNDISRVDETSLRNCTNLRIIDLTGNPIDFVSQGLYQLDPALQRIHLTRLDDWTLA